MGPFLKKWMTMATALAVAFVVFSCKGKLSLAEKLDLSVTPVQTVRDMAIIQTENGELRTRMEAPYMERYQTDTLEYESFPEGIRLYGYNGGMFVETTIVADNAIHRMSRVGDRKESWSAFGNVVIRNIVKEETMETDTLYWDRSTQEIYTDCYVRMYSPAGFLQGYGMRSDEMARDAVILRPFNSYGIVVRDSNEVRIDYVNLIGPVPADSLKK